MKVLSSGTMPDGQLYYAMEYVPGADLEHVWHEVAGSKRIGNASDLGSTTWQQAVLSASSKRRQQTVDQTSSGAGDTTSADRKRTDSLTPDGSRVVLMDFGLAKGHGMSVTATQSAGFLGTS